MQTIDNFLNKITMYRLVVYVLGIYTGVAVIYAQLGHLGGKPLAMLISLAIILSVAYVTDRGFAALFKVPSNMESWLITSLILFLIIQPANSLATGVAVGLAAALSSASKFLLAWNGKHIFNPAAFAAAFMSLWGFWPATWWIGSKLFWPLTLVLGLMVVRKVRRFPLFITFALIAGILQTLLFMHHGQPLSGMKNALLASPFIFLSTIMLTEPATMPPRRNLQVIFGAIVAVLYVSGWKIGPLIIYPEVALLLGNVFAYLVSPKFRARLTLQEIQKISPHISNYVFTPEKPFSFLPGQYMEWTLADVPYDSRGNRRTFTIASSPTEDTVQLGLKFYEPSSTFKATMHQLSPGDVIHASQLGGNFTLKGNEHKKLVFIAGGIGVTPFRSMVKYLTDTNTTCDIIVLYLVNDPAELAYGEEFRAARSVGVKTLPVITNPANAVNGITSNKLSRELLIGAIPDYAERVFYISGPNVLVDAAKGYLRSLGVPHRRIKTDHFSGY